MHVQPTSARLRTQCTPEGAAGQCTTQKGGLTIGYLLTGRVVDARQYTSKAGKPGAVIQVQDMGLDVQLFSDRPDVIASATPQLIDQNIQIPVQIKLAQFGDQPARLTVQPLAAPRVITNQR